MQQYKVRKELNEDGEVHCLAFTTPLMDFGDHSGSDQEVYGDLNLHPTIVSAKRKWKKLSQLILDERTHIPLK